MKVKVKKLHPDARIPEKAYPSDFCYDVYAVTEEEIAPNVWKYGLGLAFQIERGWEPLNKRKEENFGGAICIIEPSRINLSECNLNLSIDFRPRSSIYKTGMVLSNCEGTVDEGYVNEVSAVVYHVMPNMPRYRKGDRIGQIKIGMTFPIDFVEVEELNPTDRGMNGFGSTGK